MVEYIGVLKSMNFKDRYLTRLIISADKFLSGLI